MKIAWLMIAMLALAGCTDDPEPSDEQGEDDHSDEHDDHDHDHADEGNQTEVMEENLPPSASMSVNVTGEGPFQAFFDINGTDGNNDTLSWTLDANGDNETDASGDSLPANATVEFPEAGTFNATLTVSDGTLNVTVSINFTVGSAVSLEPFVGSGVADAPCPQCREAGANTGAGYRAGVSGADSVFLTIPEEYYGATFVVTASSGDADVSFRTSCSGGSAVTLHAGSGDETGVVPDGGACALMWNYDAADTTLTITIAG